MRDERLALVKTWSWVVVVLLVCVIWQMQGVNGGAKTAYLSKASNTGGFHHSSSPLMPM
jgi:hypothetical protein